MPRSVNIWVDRFWNRRAGLYGPGHHRHAGIRVLRVARLDSSTTRRQRPLFATMAARLYRREIVQPGEARMQSERAFLARGFYRQRSRLWPPRGDRGARVGAVFGAVHGYQQVIACPIRVEVERTTARSSEPPAAKAKEQRAGNGSRWRGAKSKFKMDRRDCFLRVGTSLLSGLA